MTPKIYSPGVSLISKVVSPFECAVFDLYVVLRVSRVTSNSEINISIFPVQFIISSKRRPIIMRPDICELILKYNCNQN